MISEDAARLDQEWELADKLGSLPDDAVILIAGAYQGKLMEWFLDKYPQKYLVLGFDPQVWAVERAKQRLQPYTGWVIQPYAIGTGFGVLPMGEYETDAASFVNTGPNSRIQGEGEIKEIFYSLNWLNIYHIDMAVFNMEGYEFQLLPYLLQTTGILRFDRFAIQWHIFEGEDYITMNNVVEKLESMGYTTVYDGKPAWSYHVKTELISG